MKKQCVSKYVYRKGFWYRTDNYAHDLASDFPNVATMFLNCRSMSVMFYHITPDGMLPAKAWYDKHGNIVVRIFHEDKQTKINF